ncbi:MAG TPA: three-Cys-motif partner protein TcmP [Longimicrobium sp.]|jgi:three-Cys-motif partner protein
MQIYNKLPHAEADDLPAPEVGDWGLQKYMRLWNYLVIFTTGMKSKHDTRVYLDLYAGAGKAILKNSREWVLGSPLLALSVRDRFDKYIFCDQNEKNIVGLTERVQRTAPDADVTILQGDAYRLAPRLRELLPAERALTFCFADPFDLRFRFHTIRQIADGRKMDLLILLAVNMDGQRNVPHYEDPKNDKIDRLLGNPNWRPEWDNVKSKGVPFPRFLADEFTASMVKIGYERPEERDFQQVTRNEGTNQSLYYLAFYSKHPRGYDFWRKAIGSSTEQRSLFDP